MCVCVCVCVVFGSRVPYNKTICIHTGRVNTTCSCPGSSVLVISARTELCPSGTSLFPQSPFAQTQNESGEKAGEKDHGKRFHTALQLAFTWPQISFCVLITLVKTVFSQFHVHKGAFCSWRLHCSMNQNLSLAQWSFSLLLRGSLSTCYTQWHKSLLQLCVLMSIYLLLSKFYASFLASFCYLSRC